MVLDAISRKAAALAAALASLKMRIMTRLLGPLARAADLVADADASLIGLTATSHLPHPLPIPGNALPRAR